MVRFRSIEKAPDLDSDLAEYSIFTLYLRYLRYTLCRGP